MWSRQSRLCQRQNPESFKGIADFGEEPLQINDDGCRDVVSELARVEVGLEMLISLAFNMFFS